MTRIQPTRKISYTNWKETWDRYQAKGYKNDNEIAFKEVWDEFQAKGREVIALVQVHESIPEEVTEIETSQPVSRPPVPKNCDRIEDAPPPLADLVARIDNRLKNEIERRELSRVQRLVRGANVLYEAAASRDQAMFDSMCLANRCRRRVPPVVGRVSIFAVGSQNITAESCVDNMDRCDARLRQLMSEIVGAQGGEGESVAEVLSGLVASLTKGGGGGGGGSRLSRPRTPEKCEEDKMFELEKLHEQMRIDALAEGLQNTTAAIFTECLSSEGVDEKRVAEMSELVKQADSVASRLSKGRLLVESCENGLTAMVRSLTEQNRMLREFFGVE